MKISDTITSILSKNGFHKISTFSVLDKNNGNNMHIALTETHFFSLIAILMKFTNFTGSS